MKSNEHPDVHIDSDVYTEPEVAAKVKLHPNTIKRLYRDHLMPPPLWIGRRKRWLRQAIDDWIANGCKCVLPTENATNE